MKEYLFHLIGVASAVSLLLTVVFVLPGALQGDFSVIREFFEKYRGIEPFVIFIFPVILIVGGAWIWRMTAIMNSNNKKRSEHNGPASR